MVLVAYYYYIATLSQNMIKENAEKKIQRNGEKSPDKGKSEAQFIYEIFR